MPVQRCSSILSIRIVRDIVRHVAGPLPLYDRGPEFHPRQSEKGERMPASRLREPEHLCSARLAAYSFTRAQVSR